MVRKTKPLYSTEKLVAGRTVNSSPSARNLPKSELGAVIFGTKNHTKEECFAKLLFGLPAPHFSYVRNITPGLPIFLFNYSNRKLHGVFEAVTPGQMCIDPKAWIESEGTVQTQYPAQVRVKTLRCCPSLSEEKFKPAILRNYYTETLFWFELDKQQTKRLIELFSPSPLPQKVTQPPNVYLIDKKHGFGMQKTWSDVVKNSSSSMEVKNDIILEPDPELVSSSGTESDSHVLKCWEDDCDHYLPNSISKVLNGESASLGPSRFEPAEARAPEESPISTSENITPCIALDPEENYVGSMTSLNITETGFSKRTNANSKGMFTKTQSFEFESVISELKQEVERLKVSDSDQRPRIETLEKELANSKTEIGKLKKRLRELECTKSFGSQCSSSENSKSSNLRTDEFVFIIGGYNEFSWLRDLDSYSPYNDLITSLCPMTSLRSYASVAKLNSEIYVFGGFHDGECYDTVESYNPSSNQWIQRPSLNQKKGSMAGVSMDDKIFAIGGGTKVFCFPDVEFFDINIGRWISSQSMLERRSAHGAVTLNGALYVAGGFDGNSYLNEVAGTQYIDAMHIGSQRKRSLCIITRVRPRTSDLLDPNLVGNILEKSCLELLEQQTEAELEKKAPRARAGSFTTVRTVERFDPRERAWRKLGSMNSRRGDHSLVSFEEKIYALGGCTGDTLLSTTEVLDTRFGRWLVSEPLSTPRRTMGSFIMGGNIYVIGGADAHGILNTMEFFDVDNPGWQMAGTTDIGKRSCFSAIVL